MIYIVCYLSSCLFAYFSFRFGKKEKYVALIFAFLAVLIPGVFAGMRDYTIGTDVNVYVKPVLEMMRKSNEGLLSLLKKELFVSETNGVFFTTVFYFMSKLRNGQFWALFIIEILCLAPVFHMIKKQELTAELKTLALFCYYCTFYHYSLNLMKQCVAVSLVFLGFEFVKKSRYFKYFVLVIIVAVLIHKSAFLGVITCFVFVISTDRKELLLSRLIGIRLNIESKKRRRKKNLLYLMAIVGIGFVFLNLRRLLVILVAFKHSYIYQLSHMKNFELKYSNFLVMTLILFPVVAFKRKTIFSDYKYRFYTFTVVISAVLYQLVGVSPALYRVSLYSLIFIVLAIPNFVALFKKDKRIIAFLYYSFVMFISFYFDVVMNSYAGVYPYKIGF